MTLNVLNQNGMSPKFNSFMTSMLSLKSNNNDNGIANNTFYAKKGEPMYQEAMDSDNDGIVSFEEFKTYCKENNISAKDMKDMIEMRMAYRMSQEADKKANNTENKELPTGSLDLIYAKDGDGNYNAELDTNKDSKVSYFEYLRYCEQNARMEAKNSDTKVVEDDKSKFMTRSFGHISNAYHKVAQDIPAGKIESKV